METLLPSGERRDYLLKVSEVFHLLSEFCLEC